MRAGEKLVTYLSELRFEDLPSAVLAMAKTCLLDHIGCGLFGSTTQWGKIAADYARTAESDKGGTVFGQAWHVHPAFAALANGTMAHGFELDDYHLGGQCHPGATVIPAALALAQQQAATGRALVEAIVVGYEAACRVTTAAGVPHIMAGFHPTGTGCTFGAAAASSRLLGLDRLTMQNAFGIAGSFASGLMEFSQDPKGNMVKRLHAGRAAEGGVTAASLAARGLTGPSTVIEGLYGFLRVFSPEPNEAPLTQGLGDQFEILDCAIKPYPCAGGLHPAIDGMRDLRREHDFGPDDIVTVVAGVSRKLVSQNAIYEPESVMAAQYSLPFNVALDMLRGTTAYLNHSEEILADPAVLALAKKIRLQFDQEMQDLGHIYGAKLEVELRDGRRLATTVVGGRGLPNKPLTEAERERKFRALSEQVIGSSASTRVIELVGDVERLANLGELFRLFEG